MGWMGLPWGRNVPEVLNSSWAGSQLRDRVELLLLRKGPKTSR